MLKKGGTEAYISITAAIGLKKSSSKLAFMARLRWCLLKT